MRSVCFRLHSQRATHTLTTAISNHMPERQLLCDPSANDFRCSECVWVYAAPRWVATDFSYAREVGYAFDRHVCGEYALLSGSTRRAL
jgi:hypothetical protein